MSIFAEYCEEAGEQCRSGVSFVEEFCEVTEQVVKEGGVEVAACVESQRFRCVYLSHVGCVCVGKGRVDASGAA